MECMARSAVRFQWQILSQLRLLHTTRVYRMRRQHFRRNMNTEKERGARANSTCRTPGIPAGATYSISEDGVAKFQKTWIMFHPARTQASIQIQVQLRMLANYGSEGLLGVGFGGRWLALYPVRNFHPEGLHQSSSAGVSSDYHYRPASKDSLVENQPETPNSPMRVWSRRGLISTTDRTAGDLGIADGRFLMAAWIPIRGWGGPLVIRELIQFPDGRIGSKWMPEVMPEIGSLKTVAAGIAALPTSRQTASRSCWFSMLSLRRRRKAVRHFVPA